MVEARASWSPAILAVAAACSVQNPLFELPEPSGSGSGGGSSEGSTADGPGSTSDMSSESGGMSSGSVSNDTTTEAGPVCGNGIQEPGEECDDANDTPGDECERNCRPLFRPFDVYPIDMKGARSVAVADFDGDGLSDVALSLEQASCDTSCVRVFLNDGDGASFTETAWFPAAGGSAPRLVVGEWGGDDLPDLAGANDSGVFVLVKDTPEPTLVTFPGRPETLLAAELGGDERTDLLIVDPGGTAIGTMLADQGEPLGFKQPVTVPVGRPVERFTVADLDDDGALDLAFSVFDGPGGFYTRLGIDANAPEHGLFESLTGTARALAVGEFGAPPWPNVVLSDPNPAPGKHTVQLFANKGGGEFDRLLSIEGEPETRFVKIVPLGIGESDNVIALATTALQIFTFTGNQVVAGPSRNFAGSLVDFAAGQLGGDDRVDLAVLTTFGCYVMINRSGE